MDKKNSDYMEDAIEPVVNARKAFNKVNEMVIILVKKRKVCDGAIITSRPNQPETIQIMYKEGRKNSWFTGGSYALESHAKKCLNTFGKIWLTQMYKENEGQEVKIQNLIIEGHTNSLARFKVQGKGLEANFLDNLELSQQRAFETIKYIIEVTQFSKIGMSKKFDLWKKEKLSANGRSFSDLIYIPINTYKGDCDGKTVNYKRCREDTANSKRVEFKYTLQHNYKSYNEIKNRYTKN